MEEGREENNTDLCNQTDHTSFQTIYKTMRNSTKVARVSCCCKLNMLVPHLQSLSSRTQHDGKRDKSRVNYNAKQ
jgi:hypothetical protein